MASRDKKIEPAGLYLSPSDTLAPKGGLLVGDECVLRRPRLLDPRPGFDEAALGTVTNIHRILNYASGAVVVQVSPSTKTYNNSVVEIKDEAAVALPWLDYAIKGQNVRDNCYLTTSGGPRKISTITDTVAYRIGAPPPVLAAETAVSGSTITAGDTVAYRAVTKRKDTNKVITRSAPSARLIYTTSTTKSPVLLVGLPPSYLWRAGDFIEIYRSFAFTGATPDDTLYLAITYELTQTDVNLGYATLTDRTVESSLGAELYTNDDIEGIEGSHITVPGAKATAYFNGSLFMGNLTFPHQIALTWSPGTTGQADGVGSRLISGTSTNGSADITGASSVVGLEVGQIVGGGVGGWGTGVVPAVITAIVGTTITVSGTWQGSTNTGLILITDSIKISDSSGNNGQYYPVAYPGELYIRLALSTASGLNQGFTTPSVRSTFVAGFYPGDINTLDGEFTSPIDRTEIILQAFYPNSPGFRVNATHGTAYSPILPAMSATGLDSTQETQSNGLAWSNNLEPEHFTGTNIDLAGPNGRILDLKACETSLLVLMDTGIWRVSGSGAVSGFRFDELDTDVKILSPDAACRMGDYVWVWGDKGIYRCDSTACINVSSGPLHSILFPIQRALTGNDTTNFGAWIVPNRKNDEIVVGVPTTSDKATAERLYVYNALTNSWLNWFRGRTTKHGVYAEVAGRLVFAASADTLRLEKAPTASDYTADKGYSITTTVRSGTAITISAGSGWTPAVGDLVKTATGLFLVVSTTDATHFVLDTAPSDNPTNAYVAYTTNIAPIGGVGTSIGDIKVWGEGSLWWDSMYGVQTYTMSFTSSISDTSVSQTRTVATGRQTNTRAEPMRFIAPNAHARSAHLFPQVSIRQGGSLWALEGFDLGFYRASDRVRSVR